MAEKKVSSAMADASNDNDVRHGAQYGMIIDTGACVGCQTCVVSCVIDHKLPDGVQWSHVQSYDGDVLYQSTGTFPDSVLKFRPTLCNHCSNPACVAACPTGAMAKDPATGIVRPDGETCIGCGACVAACPYGVPAIDPQANVSTKCTFCADLVADGVEPYCVASCPANARIFGDLSDQQSAAAQLLAMNPDAEQLLVEMGTQPNVYYI